MDYYGGERSPAKARRKIAGAPIAVLDRTSSKHC